MRKIGVNGLVPKKGKEMAEQKRKPGRPPGSKNKKSTAKTSTKKADKEKRTMNPTVKDEICAVVVIAVGIFLAIAFQIVAPFLLTIISVSSFPASYLAI